MPGVARTPEDCSKRAAQHISCLAGRKIDAIQRAKVEMVLAQPENQTAMLPSVVS
jgi:hypothetical protein